MSEGEEDPMTRNRDAFRPTHATAAACRAAMLLAAGLLAAACSAPAPEADGTDGEAVVAAADTPSAAEPAPQPGDQPTPAGQPPGDRQPEPTTDPGQNPTMCTQIACSDGLNVELDGFGEEVELELTAGDDTRTVTCLPPGPCRHFIPDFAPAEVTATAFLGDREEERTFEPEYREERPNGPDCPPVCRQASIRWKL